jgi:hypothetical protein
MDGWMLLEDVHVLEDTLFLSGLRWIFFVFYFVYLLFGIVSVVAVCCVMDGVVYCEGCCLSVALLSSLWH